MARMEKFDVMESHRRVVVQVQVCRLTEAQFRGRWALRLMRLAMRIFGGQPLIITTNLDQVLPATGEQRERAALEVLRADYMARIAAGICPHCDAPITRRVQEGRCVLAAPCGHRLYQGYLPGPAGGEG